MTEEFDKLFYNILTESTRLNDYYIRYLHLAKSPEINGEELQKMINEKAISSGYSVSGSRSGFYVNGVALLPSKSSNFGAGYYAMVGGTLGDVEKFGGSFNSSHRSPTAAKLKQHHVFIDPGKNPLNLGENNDENLYTLLRKNNLEPLYQKWLDLQHTVTNSYNNINIKRPNDLEGARAGSIFKKNDKFVTPDSGKIYSFLFDRKIITSVIKNWGNSNERKGTEISVATPNQIKTAELVTYDNENRIIGLQLRFNKNNADVRY